MQIIHGTTEFQLNRETAVAMGKFDGIHVGHRRLIDAIIHQKRNGYETCVFTFDPAPAVLFGLSDGMELSTKEEKRRIFEKLGVDILIEFPLNRETASIGAEMFVRDYLGKRMRTRYIAAGEDVSFGSRGTGDAKLLYALQDELQYQVEIIEKVCVDGARVSSTRIRGLVEKGDMEGAARLLGTPYEVSGVVSAGRKIGRTIGFPTVNLYPGADKLLPEKGVYFSRVRIGERVYPAISNVGCKPTVSDKPVNGVESFLYHFDEDVYEREIVVELLHFVRPERRFGGLEELRLAIHADMLQGEIWHEQQKGKFM